MCLPEQLSEVTITADMALFSPITNASNLHRTSWSRYFAGPIVYSRVYRVLACMHHMRIEIIFVCYLLGTESLFVESLTRPDDQHARLILVWRFYFDPGLILLGLHTHR